MNDIRARVDRISIFSRIIWSAEWLRGVIEQIVRGEIAKWPRTIRATQVEMIHVDELLGRGQNSPEARRRTAAYIEEQASKALSQGRPLAFVARYMEGQESPDNIETQVRQQLKQISIDARFSLAMTSRLRSAPIVVQPMGVLQPSQILHALTQSSARWTHGTNIWLNIYTTTPDQFDMDDPLGRFIVYMLGQDQVVPVSTLVAGAKVIAVGA